MQLLVCTPGYKGRKLGEGEGGGLAARIARLNRMERRKLRQSAPSLSEHLQADLPVASPKSVATQWDFEI